MMKVRLQVTFHCRSPWTFLSNMSGNGWMSFVSLEEDCYLYDVQYIVVSGKEERIEERFVKLHVEESGHRSVRGRCK